MQKACHNCPFRENSHLALPYGRRKEIADFLRNDAPFICHKTSRLPVSRRKVCIGSAIAMGDSVFSNLAYRLHAQFGSLNVDNLDTTGVLSLEEWESADDVVNL